MLKIYNTLTRKLEAFRPLKDKKVNFFMCGPTVYDYSHLGHAKSYLQIDIIVKYLRYLGYRVFYLQNITDIDDKIINRAKETSQKPAEVAEFFEKIYLEDMKALGIDSVNQYARATDYLPEMINQIKRLKEKGFAYQIEEGVYFDIAKFKEYGKLSHQKLKELKVHRIEENPNKRNPGDFSLWKKKKEGEPFWKSPFGDGRPGWHIEDTAITEKFFGQQYDIHGGGIDLIFPHHEAEIAQMESLSGKPLVKYWLHVGFLLVNGEKMAKSLGNFITIREGIQKWGSQAIRFLFALNHYREPINFTEESIESAKKGFERLRNTFIELKSKIKKGKKGKIDPEFVKKIKEYKKRFIKEMNNDFNTPKAMAVLFELCSDLNKYEGSKKTLKKGLGLFLELTNIFGFVFEEAWEIPEEVKKLVEQREKLRKEKRFEEADRIRKKIKNLGFWVDDTSEGPRIKKQ